MIDQELASLPVTENYDNNLDSCIFIGTKIKNRYDEKRICINEKYNPKRFFIDEKIKLYGITLTPTSEHKSLIDKIRKQKTFDLIGYNLLLQEYKLSCNDVYFNLHPPLFPIDSIHILKYIKDFNFEDFICHNLKSAKFQSFYSLNVFFVAKS